MCGCEGSVGVGLVVGVGVGVGVLVGVRVRVVVGVAVGGFWGCSMYRNTPCTSRSQFDRVGGEVLYSDNIWGHNRTDTDF